MPYVNELTRVKNQHHTELTRVKEQHHTETMALISERDSQISILRRDLDGLNKTTLMRMGVHKTEVEHIRRFHHRRLLDSAALATGNVVAGMWQSLFV